jgi:hypothetical protein
MGIPSEYLLFWIALLFFQQRMDMQNFSYPRKEKPYALPPLGIVPRHGGA